MGGRAVVTDSTSSVPEEEQRAPEVGVSEEGTTRRSGLALLAVFGVALAAGSRAAQAYGMNKQTAKKFDDDGYADFSSSKLDKMMNKDFGKAKEETKCKPRAEGEERAFCILREVNEFNRKAAEAKGEKFVEGKGTLSKGSYGV